LILFTVFLSLLFFLSLKYLRAFQIDGQLNFMPFAFLVKVTVGFIFIYVYSVYYGSEQLTADAGRFMNESLALTDVFYKSPSDYFRFLFNLESKEMVHQYLSKTTHWAGDPSAVLNDSKNLVKFHSVINFISQGYAPINMIITCFLSLFGVYHLFHAFKNFVAIGPKWLLLFLLFAPSTLFWTSGVLKEPFLFLGIGLFCRGMIGKDKSWKRVLYVFFGVYLLMSFKVYTLVFLVLAWIVYLIVMQFKRFWVGVSAISTVTIFIFVALYFSSPNKVVNLLSNKQFDFIGISKGGNYLRNDSTFFIFKDDQMAFLRHDSTGYFLTEKILVESAFPYQKDEPLKVMALPNKKPWNLAFRFNRCGSYIEVNYINYSPKKLIKDIPQAINNSTFRPYFNDPGSALKYLATLEVIVLFGFLIYAIVKRRKLSKKEKAMIVGLVVFAITMMLLIGWTTPVLGAIVRYRFSAYLALTLIGVVLLKPKLKSSTT